MKNTKRTDVHRPSEIVPADYRYLFGYAHSTTEDGWPVPGFNISLLCAQRTGRPFYAASDASTDTVEPIRDADGKPYPMAAIHKGGACDSCGAWHIEGAVFLHEPTGECIALGYMCADKMELDFDASERAKLHGDRMSARSKVIARRERRAMLRRELGKLGADVRRGLKTDHHIVADIRARFIKYGNMSEKQAALVLKLAAEANKPAERHVPAPIEEGRQTVEGVVVSTKVHDSAYGSSIKMTVKVETPEGSWLVWGTAPGSLLSEAHDLGHELLREAREANRDTPDDVCSLKGWRVRFDCKLTAGRDEHFAILKRPTKAVLVSNERHGNLRREAQVGGGAETNLWE